MKLSIEQWLDERHYSQNVQELFKEAVICYRNHAYRASLLLSYLGFLSIIRDTINKSKPPVDFIEQEWKQKIKEINDHEGWENAVYDILIQGSKPKVKEVFKLNDDLKQQLAYWRSRRNDAAHYKDNEIGGHHTEAFWSFVKSNVPKMAVNGGMKGLLNKFFDHFDDEKTAPGTDFKPLVKEISTSVLLTELPDFFEQLKASIDGKMWYLDSESYKVFNEVFNLSDEKVVNALTHYLKDKNKDIKFLDIYPNRLIQMNYTDPDLRQLWKKKMFSNIYNINPFTIYSELLRNNLIPVDEISTVNAMLFSKYEQVSNRKLPIESDIPTLIQSGFFDTIFDEAIVKKDLKMYKWVNSKCELIALLIEYTPLKNETVSCVCGMANSRYPSEWLIREINRTFSEKPAIKKSFEAIALKLGLEMPSGFE